MKLFPSWSQARKKRRAEQRALRRVPDALDALRGDYARDMAAIAAALERMEWRLASLQGAPTEPEPALAWRVCGAVDFRRPSFRRWSTLLGLGDRVHRKVWEFWYICRALEERGLLAPGKVGIGFGVGTEPLPAAFAAHGCRVLATDAGAAAISAGWAATGQWASRVDDLRRDDVCPPDAFASRVSFREVDMRAFPDDLGSADFVWSACSLEHLGSLSAGLEFVERSLALLRPGGVAIHTTELNLTPGEETLESGETVLYRESDIQAFREKLAAAGYGVTEIERPPAAGLADSFVDVPPFSQNGHLRLQIWKFVTTSVGMIIERRG